MDEKPVFTVDCAPEEMPENERAEAMLDYVSIISEITEGTGIQTNVREKLNEALAHAKRSGENTLIQRAYHSIVDHYANANMHYTAGLNAIKAGFITAALDSITALLDNRENDKALDLAARINAEVVEKCQEYIRNKQERDDCEYFRDALCDPGNVSGFVLVVNSPIPEFRGAYYLRENNDLGRNYAILDGFKYLGTVIRSEALSRFKMYTPLERYKEPELIKRLYQMYEEIRAQKRESFITRVEFQRIPELINGRFSLVAINKEERAMLITEPVIRCVRSPASRVDEGERRPL